MPVVRKIKGRGATGVLVVAAEPLFAQTGDVGRWTNRLSQRVRSATSRAAPTNKRPRWAHYGKPLKQTFTASTAYQPERLRVYAGIGSSAPHALYVDQGTSAFEAKILPPWTRGGPTLREATYKYPTSNGGRASAWKATGGIPVSGQRAQNFFAAGLTAGLASMDIRTIEVPVDGGIEGIIDGIPASLTDTPGNTPVDAAFIAQLEEWRAWRNEGWLKYQRERPRPSRARGRRTPTSIAERREQWREASQRYRDKNRKPSSDRSKSTTKDGPTKAEIAAQYLRAIKQERLDLIAQATAKYKDKSVSVSGRLKHDGIYQYKITLTKNGRSVVVWVPSDFQAGL